MSLLRTLFILIILVFLSQGCSAAEVKNKSEKDVAYTEVDKFAQNKSGIEKDILSLTVDKYDFNDTLHSPIMKSRVLFLADITANASYYTMTGYVRDHNKREFIFLSNPPLDRHVTIKQARKLIKFGRALKRTNNDEYVLAGSILIDLARAITQEEKESAKRLISKYEDYFSDEINYKEGKVSDSEFLSDISNSIVSEVSGIVNTLSGSLQEKAINALNLKNVLGGKLL